MNRKKEGEGRRSGCCVTVTKTEKNQVERKVGHSGRKTCKNVLAGYRRRGIRCARAYENKQKSMLKSVSALGGSLAPVPVGERSS